MVNRSIQVGRSDHNIEAHGNSSASTMGIALDELLRGLHGPVPDPAVIVLTAVRGGYTMGATVLAWRGGAVAGHGAGAAAYGATAGP